jgi:hypothetical protein
MSKNNVFDSISKSDRVISQIKKDIYSRKEAIQPEEKAMIDAIYYQAKELKDMTDFAIKVQQHGA